MKWFKNLTRDNILYSGLIITFIILYGATAFVSWYHAIDLFLIGNAIMLAIILSFVAEVGQASALFSILLTKNKHKFLTWSVMIILTTLQVIGNVYATYDFITKHNSAGVESFQKAILFFMPTGDPEIFKVIIAWILGALLPIIALSMTALVAQNMILRAEEAKTKFDKENQPESIDAKDIISEVSKIRPTQEELDELESLLSKKEPIRRPPIEENELKKNEDVVKDLNDIQRSNRPDTSDEIHEEWSKMYDEINKDNIITEENEFESIHNIPDEQLANEEVIPHFSDEEINKMNQDEYERKNLYQQESDDMDEDVASLIPDIQEDPIDEPEVIGLDESNGLNDIPSVPEIIVTNTNGLVEGITGNMGISDLPSDSSLSSSSEISPEARKTQEEERLERLRAIARENSKKK